MVEKSSLKKVKYPKAGDVDKEGKRGQCHDSFLVPVSHNKGWWHLLCLEDEVCDGKSPISHFFRFVKDQVEQLLVASFVWKVSVGTELEHGADVVDFLTRKMAANRMQSQVSQTGPKQRTPAS